MPSRKYLISCEICGNRTDRVAKGEKIFMAKFPLDEARCMQWVKFVGKEDLVYVPIEKLHTLKHVCGKHFRDKDFNKKKNRLKRSAIPSRFLKGDPLPDGMFLEFPFHIHPSHYSSQDMGNEVSSPQVEAVAGPSNSDLFITNQQLHLLDHDYYMNEKIEASLINEETVFESSNLVSDQQMSAQELNNGKKYQSRKTYMLIQGVSYLHTKFIKIGPAICA